MDRIYLAGPISVVDWDEAKSMFKRMSEYAIMALGYAEVINPVDHPSPDTELEGDDLWQHYMKVSVRKLSSCDAILLAPNYQISKGARLERYLAEELGLEIHNMPRGFNGEVR